MSNVKKATIGVVTATLVALGYEGYTVIGKDRLEAYEEKMDQYELLVAQGEVHGVAYVIDGDTLKLDNDERVRLIGIDAPDKDECYYQEATEALRKALGDNDIRMFKDVEGVDELGRLLRYVFSLSPEPKEDNIFLSEYMLRNGYAQRLQLSKNKIYERLFIAAENEAQRKKKGIWGKCDIELPSTSVLREEDTAPPRKECSIKGNISEKDALRAGFRKAENCP